MAGKGNYPRREAKKPKKDAHKPKGVSSVAPPPAVVQLIKKERVPKRTEEEQPQEE